MWKSLRSAALALGVGAAVFIAPGHAEGASVVPLTPEQVLANSDMVFLGRIEGASTRWSGVNESMIATDYRVRLERVLWDPRSLHGAVREGESVVLSFAGGAMGDKMVWIPGVPKFGVGERAFFFMSESDKGAVSPLVGFTAGVNRVAEGRGRGEVLGATTGVSLTHSFFGAGEDRAAGFTAEEYSAEIVRALPIAKADAGLVFRDDVPDAAHRVPSAQPIPGPGAAPGVDRATEAPAADPLIAVKTPGVAEPGQVTNDPVNERIEVRAPEMFGEGPDRYTYLWGSPNSPSVFNIPPQYYGTSNWGLNFEYSLSDWNRYATLFRKYTTSTNTFGHQGRNDYAFVDPALFQATYGFALGGTTLGIAVMYNYFGFSIGVGSKIYESDVILNSTKSWTSDFKYAYTHPGTYYVRSTTIHELGHCFGREHQFTGEPNAVVNSVMNYTPAGALDAEFFLPFIDDALSIRNKYGSAINNLTDVGVHLFRSAGGLNGNGHVTITWSPFPAAVQAGNNFQVTAYMIENLGTNTAPAKIDWYLTPSQFTYAGAVYCSRSSYPNIPANNQYNATGTVRVPLGTTPGDYYIAAALPSDSFDSNRSAWSNTKITVTAPPPPPPPPVPNDFCAAAIFLSSGSTHAGTTAGSTPSPIAEGCPGTLNANDAWYYVDAGCRTDMTVRVCSTQGAFSPAVSIYKNIGVSLDCPLDANAMVACAGAGTCNPPLVGCFSSACISINAGSGRYLIRVANAASDGTFTISYDGVATPAPANDDCGAAEVLLTGAAYDLCTATPTPGSPTVGCNGATIPVGKDLWYVWTAPDTGETEVNTCGESLDTVVEVYEGGCAGTVVGCSDDDCAVGSVVQFTATGGTNYYIRIAGYDASEGAGVVAVTFTPPTTCQGDLDEDGTVETDDLLILLAHFGGPATPSEGDIDHDGTVTTYDLVGLIKYFGQSCF